MSNQISTQTITFNNQYLITFEKDGTQYTAMKPICENIGLAWEAQLARIKRDTVLSQGMIVMITPSNGGDQQMICLPINYLNGWLFGVNENRVKPKIKETLIKYKKECYQALFDYWTKGKAERKTTVDERTGLRQAVDMLVAKKKLLYPEAYNLVHHRFNVEHIDELSPEQLPQAVEYVHKICLEGELITNTQQSIQIDEEALNIMLDLYGYCNQAYEMREKLKHTHLKRYIDDEIGAYYLHNLGMPLKNKMDKAKGFMSKHSEHLTRIKATQSLLN
ncbi:phage antirepressor N-terminal domain-containing protein [Phocoenobacter skyensis]|uniref:Phage antirepressor N-terminal domain-containing protein n=1 Tax=Phocoenobacter skyensis TaxID=97481 RepID=A0ABT9JID5_9PAST|nr:phage antirepressor N-terminal domain-containing protein [Pasteurella skyensis]MDP8078331.1 phage antirepressor N-terminal domain-containing protein [Pasteurella skyensis]MDP8084577.1 phage antirepressor N-terminal domain-containing protein [Pasteurella skyensis]